MLTEHSERIDVEELASVAKGCYFFHNQSIPWIGKERWSARATDTLLLDGA